MNAFSEKERIALEKFFMEFNVRTISLASQAYSIDPFTGYQSYEDTYVFGDTSNILIEYDGDTIHEIEEPRDDMKALTSYAVKWYEAGRPTPREETDFFK